MIQVINRAALDGVEFRTARYEEGLLSANSCISCLYNERDNNQAQTKAYGIIKKMYIHQMYPGEDDDIPSRVIVDCDWFEVVGTNPTTGLKTIAPNPTSKQAALCACQTAWLKTVCSGPLTPGTRTAKPWMSSTTADSSYVCVLKTHFVTKKDFSCGIYCYNACK